MHNIQTAKHLIISYPDEFERSNHILGKQLYGIALSQVSLERTTKKLRGYDHNLRVIPNYIGLLKGIRYGNNMQEIINREFGKDMKIDVVIGNPPYQEESGGRNATPLYNRFVEMGMNICSEAIWITPSRWFSGGIGLDSFRHNILSSNRIKTIINYKQAYTIFNGVDISGGVCIIYICEHANEIVFIDGETNSNITIDSNFIKEKEMLLNRCEAYSIVGKARSNKSMSSMVLPLNAFSLNADFEGSVIKDTYNNIEVIGSHGNISYININDPELFTKQQHQLLKHA